MKKHDTIPSHPDREDAVRLLTELVILGRDAMDKLRLVTILAIQLDNIEDKSPLTPREIDEVHQIRVAATYAEVAAINMSRRCRRLDDDSLPEMEPFNWERAIAESAKFRKEIK